MHYRKTITRMYISYETFNLILWKTKINQINVLEFIKLYGTFLKKSIGVILV